MDSKLLSHLDYFFVKGEQVELLQGEFVTGV